MSRNHKGPHKYQRVRWGKNKTIIFKCMRPGCTHYLHPEMMKGQDSICWSCGDIFMMNPDKLRRKKPKCDKCQSGKKAVAYIEGKLDYLLGDLK